MKKTLTIIILAIGICTASHAQYAAGHRTLFRESGNLYTSEGIPLDITTAEELLSPDAFRQYRTGKGLFISGIAVSATGGAFFLGGTASIIAGFTLLGKEHPPGLPFIIAGYMSIITGGVLAVLSIPLYCTGISQLNKAARSTRAQGLAYVPQLSLGAQPSGIGLGIRF
ncbi:MAG TPA: hypothetical protein IAB87_09530 [Candidatus Coprenecus merdipullorum]|nr:hypothetical protein [Candidatus Coprenecus merdipullorum]